MVQCRQLYVFAHGTLLGWCDARNLVEHALASILATYGGRDSRAPYVFSVTRAGEVVNRSQDSYAYAFLLLALAWARKLLGDAVNSALPRALIVHLRTVMAHPSGLGFIDVLPRPDALSRQNPQMHLLEACLAVEEAFGDVGGRGLADNIFLLFRTQLFSVADRTLPELYDEHWRVVEPDVATYEPGHHFEWIWLLDRYAARSDDRVEDLIAGLAARACLEGIDEIGAVVERVRIHDGLRFESRRCWGTCEALKAAASDFEQGRSDPRRTAKQAARFLNVLRRVFLPAPFAGGWIDRVDARAQPLLDYVPASTLYHIFLAVAEAERVFGQGELQA